MTTTFRAKFADHSFISLLAFRDVIL